MIRVGCDRVGVEIRGGRARPGDRIDHVEVLEGEGSVKSDQVPRGKLWRVIKSAFICFCQAGDDIALLLLIADDVHPYRINYCDGPISSRARQLNRDIEEVPRVIDRNVVNVASSKHDSTADQIRALFRQEGVSTRLGWAKSTSVA